MHALEWWLHENKTFPHLSVYKATVRGLTVQYRQLWGSDFNIMQNEYGSPDREYEAHLSFRNDRCEGLKHLGVLNHAIGMQLVRPSEYELRLYLESLVNDLLSATKEE